MNCRRVRHLLFDFVDGLGNEALHAEVDRHLAQCAECETFAAQVKQSLGLLRRVPAETLDENFNWKVRLAIHREQKASARSTASSGAWVRAWNFRYVASTGVAFALVLGAGVVAMQQVTSRETTVVSREPAAPAPAPAPVRSQFVERQGGTTGAGPIVVVSDGDDRRGDGLLTSRGAIDRYAEEVAIDSLIDARLIRMSPEMRMRIIQRQIHRLQSQLEVQRTPPAQP